MPKATSLVFASLTLLTSHLAHGQTNSAMPASLLWDKSFNVRGGFGYRDNVLLGSMSKQESTFVYAGVDALIYRLPVDGTQFYFFLTADDYHYLQDIPVDKEQTFIAVAKLERQINPAWATSFSLQYFYQDQVLDVSATEAVLTTAQLMGHSIKGTPSIKRKLGDHYSVELELPANRQFLEEPLDDYWEVGPKLTLERSYGHRSSLSLSYEMCYRPYDDRTQATSSGASVPGTSLAFYQHEFELGQHHYWDKARRWRSDTKLSLELNQDNGSGFFDYHRYGFSEQLRYTADSWNVKGSARVYQYNYLTQLAEAGDSSHRNLLNASFTIRAEKNLTKSFKLYTQFDHEQAISNRAFNEYRANSIVTGFDWEF